MTTTSSPLPRAPVFGWNSLSGARAAGLPSVDDLPHRVATSSGRAAIFNACKLLDLPQGSAVLVPTYHCPSMVAAIVRAGLRPRFFAIDEQGLPDLDRIDPGPDTGAMLVAHYFGIPRSLAAVRAYCDLHGIALIEDCAHAFFGHAGERPVGAWGDFSVASLSKFFPGPESGLLASATRPIQLAAEPAGLMAEIKGIADTLQTASEFRRLQGLNAAIGAAFALKPRRAGRDSAEAGEAALPTWDLRRVTRAPTTAASWLHRALPRGRIVACRRANFDRYARWLAGSHGTRALDATRIPAAAGCAPYVFPLWVEDADRVYDGLRARGAPVLRWDQVWESTPRISGDRGSDWSRHVLQLLCHQDLSEDDVAAVASAARVLLEREAVG